ncbi:MAG: hypothetical protein ACK4UN_00785 [Limisphaerales bacterium]
MQPLINILLVEPNAFDRDYIIGLLNAHMSQLTSLQSFEEARKLLFKPSPKLPDVVLLGDEGLDRGGLKLLREIRAAKNTSQIPVILLTDLLIDRRTWCAFEDDGITFQVVKPVTYTKLTFAFSAAGILLRTNPPA